MKLRLEFKKHRLYNPIIGINFYWNTRKEGVLCSFWIDLFYRCYWIGVVKNDS